MFLHYGKYLHYHLSGSDNGYLNYSPNNIMLFEAISKGVGMGLEKMHLGGGRTCDPEDQLLKFKKSFSSSVVGFHIGKRIHDRETYGLLMSAWEKRQGKKPELFLQYEKKGD
jgi:lipid II:glycine glycyltransferase (peptidoglycan interpeptide bridge formation enzyme)